MSGKSIIKVTSLLLPILLVSACGGAFSEHPPGPSEAEAIKALLLAYQQAWNKHDEPELASLLDEGFIIWLWVRGERKIVATKGSYVFWLRDLFIRFQYLTFGTPEIWVRDDGATVYVPMTVDAHAVRATFRLIKRGERWLIQEFEF